MIKPLIISFVFVSVIFLIIDVIWLSFSVKTIYKPYLGDLIRDTPIMWAAVLFYLIYVIGLSLIILRPALINDSITQAFWTGIIFGVVAYGTYNLTNMATIKGWSYKVVFVDMIWGGVLTSFSSYFGILIAKKFLF